MDSYKSYTVKEATLKLMKFCTYRERCHQEVEKKLHELNMIPEAQNLIISKLIAQNFLNEERFVQIFVRDKFNLKKWGKYRIKRELKFRNISDYLIRKGLKEIDDSAYLKTLEKLIEKRRQQISETHPLKIKKKIADYLLRKGYESALVYEKIQDLDLS